MSSIGFLLLTLVIFQVVAYPDSQKYCAVIKSSETGGISGYFGMKIDSSTGTATYGWSIDMRGYTNTNGGYDINLPLLWHIHTDWNKAGGSSSKSGVDAACSQSNTGNHYDPLLACGPASQGQIFPTTGGGSFCSKLGRTSTSPPWVYPCDKATYQAGQYSNCEVGDLSGKFGNIVPVDGQSKAVNSDVFIDPNSPFNYNYGAGGSSATGTGSMDLSLPWNSIVFHKSSDKSRFFCALLLKDNSGKSPCDDGMAFGPPPTAPVAKTTTSDDTYTQKDLMKWVIISIILTIVLNVVLYFVCGFLDCINPCSDSKRSASKKGGNRRGDRLELSAKNSTNRV
jgi:hypothetical protein